MPASSSAAHRLNPAYVLSAICMIFGLFSLNGSLDFSPLPAHNLLVLIAVLNLYEVTTLLIAWLLHRRRIVVDARTLLVIESLFLFDGAFLTSELITVMPSVGGPIALVLLLAAILKTWVILAISGHRLVGRVGALSMLMLAVLVALPWTYQHLASLHAGVLSAGGYYAGWWLIATVPIAAAFMWRREDGAMAHTVLGIGVASMLAHVATAAWVNKVDFSYANLAPVILGMALIIGHRRLLATDRRSAIRAELLLPILAAALSAKAPVDLTINWMSVTITPLRLALIGAAGVYMHGWLRHRDWSFAIALLGGCGLAIAGATTQAIGSTVGTAVRHAIQLIKATIPRTLSQWGWISVVSAFIFMVGGAFASIRKAKLVMVEEEATPTPTKPE